MRGLGWVRLLPVLAIAGGCGVTTRALGPPPYLYIDAEADPFADVPEELRTPEVSILYATDRTCAEANEKGPVYTGLSSRRLVFGAADVRLGKEGGTWQDLVDASRGRPRDGPFPLTITSVREIAEGPPVPRSGADDPAEWDSTVCRARLRFYDTLEERLEKSAVKEVLLFIHGYNVKFDEAVFDLAEMWHMLGRRGVPLLYSWPAGGEGALGYLSDSENGMASIGHLKYLLAMLGRCPGLEKVHLVAHSRGNAVLIQSLLELHIACRAAGLGTRETLKLGNLVMIAADLDSFVVKVRYTSEDLDRVPERLTVYSSPRDRALGLSAWLQGGVFRIGGIAEEDLPPYVLQAGLRRPWIDFVENKTTGYDPLGHCYFRTNPAVSSDLVLLLRYGRDPGAENGRPLSRREGSPVWKVKDGYPFGLALPTDPE